MRKIILKVFAITLLLSFMLAFSYLLSGCLQPEATSPTSQIDNPDAIPSDPELRAGASSSTNWPTKSADNPIQISLKADSQFSLHFLRQSFSPLDTNPISVKLSGIITAYQSGIIPALDSVPYTSQPFANSDSIQLSRDMILKLGKNTSDTVWFNLNIKSDTGEVWTLGYGFVKSKKKFLITEYAAESINSIIFSKSGNSFKGLIDTTIKLTSPTLIGHSVSCFYIPGTPLFWPINSDTLSFGPLPKGQYPLRLLKLTSASSNSMQTEVSVFQISTTRSVNNPTLYQFIPVEKIFSKIVTTQLHFKTN